MAFSAVRHALKMEYLVNFYTCSTVTGADGVPGRVFAWA